MEHNDNTYTTVLRDFQPRLSEQGDTGRVHANHNNYGSDEVEKTSGN